jgi:hypothetical protein
VKYSLRAMWFLGVLVYMASHAEKTVAGSNDWLLDAETDEQRFELLQDYLGGFSQSMWEVGERYVAIHESLTRENFELASYHWEKIRSAIRNGYLKRPARRANSDALFLDELWGEVHDAFQSGDADNTWAGFGRAKEGCMACHAAEGVPFMNDQSMFELGRPE